MAAYNHARYIGEAIASVLSQSWRDLELIVVDDGSTDDTRQVVAGFGDAVRYIHQHNQGQGGARNTGIAHARGEFISFLDDDDLWLPHCAETAMNALRPHPEVGAFYAACQVIDSNGNRLPQVMSRVVPPEQMYDALVEGGWFPPLVVTVRKSVLEDVGPLDPALRGTDDWELWLRVASSHCFKGASTVVGHYRMHGGGLSANTEHMLADKKRAIAKHFGPEEGDFATWPDIRRRAYGSAYRMAGLAHMEIRNTSEGQARLRQAFQLLPELARRIDVFYELACGFQPRGFRGDFGSLNLEESEALVFDTLRFIFDSPETCGPLTSLRNSAWANAYLALGMLAYGSGQMRECRSYLVNAFRMDPGIRTDSRLASRYFKSFAGKRILRTVRLLEKTGGTGRRGGRDARLTS
jgi:glycosyltransferase involved in cell wall biosynthesis